MFDPARSLELDGAGVAVAPTPVPRPRLLVIDDDKLHRMIICRGAAKAGYAPAGAATYDEAATILQDGAFDCITLALSLGPHADAEMLRHLSGIGCKAPIIVISGRDDATCSETIKIARSLNLNIWETIRKPVNLGVLQYWFERIKAERETAAAAAA
jgi:two-component system, chemotaxis family, chemotaxis protein CheY